MIIDKNLSHWLKRAVRFRLIDDFRSLDTKAVQRMLTIVDNRLQINFPVAHRLNWAGKLGVFSVWSGSVGGLKIFFVQKIFLGLATTFNYFSLIPHQIPPLKT